MRRIVGNIGCFRLSDSKYGFGRIFQDACVAFYKHIGASEKDIPQTEDYAFIVGVYDTGVKKMKLVEKRPYSSIEEVTAPPDEYEGSDIRRVFCLQEWSDKAFRL